MKATFKLSKFSISLHYNSLPCELNAEPLGGGITAETGRSSQFFLDFEVIE